jgi:O-methyltransferase involved in polyketide biosynthesis
MTKVKPDLCEGIESAIVALWVKARLPPRDPDAEAVLQKIDYDFSRFERWRLFYHIMNTRTDFFDLEVKRFLKRHPDSVIVNVGAGLDTRFSRVDTGSVLWYELDLPQVIALRRQLFKETDCHKSIACSVTDPVWIDYVDRGNQPMLIVAEAVLLYLSPEEVAGFFSLVTQRFPGSELVFDVIGPQILQMTKPLLKRTMMNPKVHWTISSTTNLSSLNKDLAIISSYDIGDTLLSLIVAKILKKKMIHAKAKS